MKEEIKESKDEFENEYLEVKTKENNTGNAEDNRNQKKSNSKKDIKPGATEKKEDIFNIYSVGSMVIAKKHRSATRPKKQIQYLTEAEERDHICPCCGLPEKVRGKIEYFNTCDNPDDFSNCGQGVVLYYDYIKFVIIISFIASVGMAFFNLYFSYKYYTEMTKVCNNYYHEIYETKTDKTDYYKECQYYMTDSDIEKDGDNIKRIDSFFFQFSSVNIKDYRAIFKKLNEPVNDSFESTIINLSLVNSIILFLLFVFNLLYIYFLFNKSNAADYLVFTVSDYAVFLTNLYGLYTQFKENLEEVKEMEKKFKDKGKQIELEWYNNMIGFKPTDDMIEIKQFETFLIEKIFKERKKREITKDYGVNRIDFCYKSGEIINLQQELSILNEKINKIDFDPNIKKENEKNGLKGKDRSYYSYILPFCPFTSCPKKESREALKEDKKKAEEKMKKLIKDSKEHISEYFGGAAFITFNKIKQQEEYLAKLPSNFFDYIIDFFKDMKYLFCSCCIDKNSTSYYKRNLNFEAAPEPADIIFENIETSQLDRIIKTAIVYLISVILCGISFAAIYGLNLLQMYVDENQKNQTTHVVLLYVISFAITGVTSGMDILLEIVLEKLTKWEKQMTWTNYYLSFSIKLTLFSFVNSAILPTFCEFFINNSDGFEILISNMLMKFLVNAIVTPGMWRINIGYYIKKIKIYYITNKEEIDINQKDLNELYEFPPMNVSAKYSYIAKTILMSFFYIPIFPLGIIISFLGFIFAYWIEKYNFANMYKIPEMLNRQITEFYTNYFVLVFFVYGIGDYVFLRDTYENRTWSLVNIIVFGVLIIFPYHQMLTFDYLKFEESQIYEKDYDDKYTEFTNDYERANPMTEKEGKLRFLEAKKAKGEIKEEEFMKEKNEIQNEDTAFTYQGSYKGPSSFGNPFMEGGFGPTFFKRIQDRLYQGSGFGGGGYPPQDDYGTIQEEEYPQEVAHFPKENPQQGGYNSVMANNNIPQDFQQNGYNSGMASHNYGNDRMNLNFKGPQQQGYSSQIAQNNIGNDEMYISSNVNFY